MVVDDEQPILRLLNRTLEPEGYGVVAANNDETALALLEDCRSDLVILDVMMPGLDGFQVLVGGIFLGYAAYRTALPSVVA